MSVKVNVHEAKTQLSKLFSRVEKGEEIIICKSDRPTTCLHPLEIKADRRIPGSAKRKVIVAENFYKLLLRSIFSGYLY